MADRKEVFIGAYVPADLKKSLRRRAAAEQRTLSQEITRILTEAVRGRTLPLGALDRRAPDSPPRRRAYDPPERRRKEDLPVGFEEDRHDGEDEHPAAKVPGKARRHFGAWDSGDERSADNERIDLDLAREYGDFHQR